VYARLRGGGGFRLGDMGRGGGGIVTAGLEELSNGAQWRFDCVSIIFRGICMAVSSPGPEGGSMEYGFISGESATGRMLSRLLAALVKDSPDVASGEVARANEGERGRAEPDPETEKRLLRERTPLAARGVTGRERKLGGFGEKTSSLEDTICCTLFASSGSSGTLEVGSADEESIPCIRIESITSKSPRGSSTPDGLDGIPRPARTDLHGKIIRKFDDGHHETRYMRTADQGRRSLSR
jgi:hypothetical protein